MRYQQCEECNRLLAEYRESNARMVAAGRKAAEAGLSWEYDFFKRVWDEARAAHEECMRLGRNILRHLETHGQS